MAHKSMIRTCLITSAYLLCAGGMMAQNTARSMATTPEATRIRLATEEDAKAFVAEELKKPLPEDYQIPSYITSGYPLAQVYDSVSVRFPDFYGKRGDEYLHAIMKDPETYLKLNKESKAIRMYYDPNYNSGATRSKD